MSSDTITIAVEKRDIIGKQVHKLRREGMVPANIYERGEASVALTAPLTILTKVYGEAGKHHLACIRLAITIGVFEVKNIRR